MLVPGSSTPLLAHSAAAAATGISRSLRFNSSDSAYLSRTPASAGNRKIWTLALWVKRSNLSDGALFHSPGTTSGTAHTWCNFSGDTLQFYDYTGSVFNFLRQTAQVFRDPSAWYHLVFVVDTDNGTAANRARIYVNGSEVTTWTSTSTAAPGFSTAWNNNALHQISSQSQYFNGYLADIYFIDGQALTPTSFTETDATTGQLIPKAYTGSYGSQGWHLEFADNSSNTATTLGKDTSGNSNNWTPNNLSVTAGAGNDSLVDVPINGSQTDTGVGGEVRGNYCTINPLNNGGVTLVNGNLDWTRSAAGSTAVAYSTIAVSSGKWYFETTMNGAGSGVNWECGVATTTTANNIRPGTTATGWGLVTSSTTIIYKQNSNSLTSIFSGTLSTGDVIGVAFDLDNGRIWFARNGTWLEGSPSAGTGASYTNLSGTVSAFFGGDGTAVNGAANFGARSFAYTAPSGFKALCTANLPAPLVTKPSTVFDAKLYTGNGSTQTISGLGFSPDFVWLKNRSSGSYGHRLVDSVRGSTLYLMSHSTGAEATDTNGVTAFNSDGFNLGNSGDFNVSSNAFVAWAWDAGSSTVTNTAGSITSSVRANTTAGFSIVTYTGTGANATVGHGLGVAPSFVIVKSRSNTTDWQGYHIALGQNYTIQLQSTSAAINVSNYWNGGVSSTTFGINGSYDGINFSGYTYVAYCFAPVVGYSSFGSYTGNGSTDGPFVYTGFRPRWVLIKRSDSTSNWFLVDTARDTSNVSGFPLFPNDPASEVDIRSNTPLDILSNGFKLRTSTLTGGTNINISSATYIYAAFAESPFNYARAR